MATDYWTGLCTSCGDQWEEDERPVVCPECGFTGVVAVEPGQEVPGRG